MRRRSPRATSADWPRPWLTCSATTACGPDLAERGATAVRALTWDRAARATADVYRTLGLAV